MIRICRQSYTHFRSFRNIFMSCGNAFLKPLTFIKALMLQCQVLLTSNVFTVFWDSTMLIFIKFQCVLKLQLSIPYIFPYSLSSNLLVNALFQSTFICFSQFIDLLFTKCLLCDVYFLRRLVDSPGHFHIDNLLNSHSPYTYSIF